MDNRRPPVPVVISRGVINEASLTCGLRQEVKAPVETTYIQRRLWRCIAAGLLIVRRSNRRSTVPKITVVGPCVLLPRWILSPDKFGWFLFARNHVDRFTRDNNENRPTTNTITPFLLIFLILISLNDRERVIFVGKVIISNFYPTFIRSIELLSWNGTERMGNLYKYSRNIV